VTGPSQGLSLLAPGGGGMIDPGNEVDEKYLNKKAAFHKCRALQFFFE